MEYQHQQGFRKVHKILRCIWNTNQLARLVKIFKTSPNIGKHDEEEFYCYLLVTK